MKNILLFGAGKSASILIEYLLNNAEENNWHTTIVDTNKQLIEQKVKNHISATAVEANITDDAVRKSLVAKCDIVISMMPPFLHILIAKDCVEHSKHLLTASYEDEQIKLLENDVKNRGIIFLCEMGLDPGIDHMSAMQLIDTIQAKGAKITSFKSHCGGLVAPESDNNPWQYKISWNPRNVVLAGKTGAIYKENNVIISEKYETLFDASRTITNVEKSVGTLSYYPNRDSLPYIDLYGLKEAHTFIRTTLRYPSFMKGWHKIIALKLTDEEKKYDSDSMSLTSFFKTHFAANNIHLSLENDDAERLNFLGLNDDETLINKGKISAADGLQFALEKKLLLAEQDKDMIVMQHEIAYEKEGVQYQLTSSMMVKGNDNIHTAMAKTVGLPLGIAAKLILNNTIQLSGIHLPICKEIYNPVLQELQQHGIIFKENISTKN